MRKENNLIWLDMLRGIAALLVVIGHLRTLIFKDFNQAGNGGIGLKFFYFITGFGHQAVIVFFVLSGFFIISSIHNSVINHKWNLSNYVINRLTRLWVVLIPALLLGWVFDWIGLHYYTNSYTYSGCIQTLPGINPSNSLQVKNFVGNLFFLQTIIVPTFGSNGALWSLANEFWYYVLFPLLYFSFKNGSKIRVRIMLFFLFVLLFYILGAQIDMYFLVWLMGGLTYVLINADFLFKSNLNWKIGAISLLFIIVIICSRLNKYGLIFNDFSLGIITAILISAFAKKDIRNNMMRRLSLFFAGISFSVYLTHLPFAVIVVSIINSQRLDFTGLNLIVFLIALLFILCYSYLNYYLFERKTGVVKEQITKQLMKCTEGLSDLD